MRNSNKCIIPECYIDSCLIEVLLKADKDFVNHHKGNGKVAHEMKNTFGNTFCVGIIDEDKEALDYLKEFEEKKVTPELKLWKHQEKHHYIIQIRPAVEKWILKICGSHNIRLADYRLPDELREFCKITKSVSSRKDVKFVGLFKEIFRMGCEPATTLKKWVEYLKLNKENSNVDLL
ncbi:MAG: hypothetical protein WAT19_13445 [Ferruginibacter sp.]